VRTGKREAAPCSRCSPKAHPATPGRKAGNSYGRPCRRPIPDRVEEGVEVPLPGLCPHCGTGVKETGAVSQYQPEVPEPSSGADCVSHSSGLFPALPAAGARATSGLAGGGRGGLAVAAASGSGYPTNRWCCRAVLEQAWGLRVSRGGLCHAFCAGGQKRPNRTIRPWGNRFAQRSAAPGDNVRHPAGGARGF
jgi:hypothetical protein